MKTLLITIFLVAQVALSAQCPTGDVLLTTQAEVTAYGAQYGNCSLLSGNLTIEEATAGAITNLSDLSSLTSVSGDVFIRNNSALADITGLENVVAVGGEVRIENNQGMTTLDGFAVESLESLYIRNNPILASLPNDTLTSIGHTVDFSNNDSLSNLNGFKIATSLKTLAFTNNPLLTSIEISAVPTLYITTQIKIINMNGLTEVNVGSNISIYEYLGRAFLMIENCDNIIGFNSNYLISGRFSIRIQNNANLSSIDRVNSSLYSSIFIKNNPILVNLQLGVFGTRVKYDVTIENNPSLVSLTGLGALEYVERDFTIRNNASLADLSGLEDLIAVTDLEISYNQNLINFNSFDNFTNVVGDFVVRGNPSLVDIGSFPLLERIYDKYIIEDNPSLISLGDYNQLEGIQYILDIRNNASLTNIGHWPSMDGYYLFNLDIFIVDCPSLTTTAGMSTFSRFSELEVVDCPQLQSFSGFNHTTNFRPKYHVENTGITDLDGFVQFQTLNLINNSSLQTLSGITLNSNFLTVPGTPTIVIEGNPILADINGLRILSQTENIWIENNPSLTNLDSLSNLTTTRTLNISSNPALQNLNGLSSLSSVQSYISIYNNSLLSTLEQYCGLHTAVDNGLHAQSLHINANPLNPTAAAILAQGSCASVLPVTLTTFQAKAQAQSTHLIWQTTTEINNAGFHVERSADGRQWQSLSFVEGAGTTQQKRSYTYTDAQPRPSMNYYRLRQVDFDGAADYSEVVSVFFQAPGATVSYYPNPTRDELILEGELEGVYTLRDLHGRVVRTISGGGERAVVDVRELASGVYVLWSAEGVLGKVIRK